MTRQKIFIISGCVLVFLFSILIFCYINYWRGWENTDNAYVEADISMISAKITSYVEDIKVEENQHVKKGDLLVVLRSVEAQANVQEANANIEAAQASLLSTEAKLNLQKSIILEQKANVELAQVEYLRAKREYDRTENLGKTDIFSKKQLETINATYLKSAASVKNAEASLASTQEQIPVLMAEKKQTQAKILQAEAKKLLSLEDQNNTKIFSALDGIVGNKVVQLGQLVRPGQQLMALVPLKNYIYANFKETQVEHMHLGQTVKIYLDTYPNHEFKGTVHSFSPASGAVFSLLPPENATGNFTKIVQRIPVKIVFDDVPAGINIRPGMSATVKINTIP